MINIEKKITDAIAALPEELKNAYNEYKNNDISFNLENKYITSAILLRLKAFVSAQSSIKELLNKKVATSAADFFVEQVLFFAKLIVEENRKDLKVFSEKAIRDKRGMIRPDISIWQGDSVLAIIECKTNLGWNRKNWEDDFDLRESKLRDEFPKANAFLLVLTTSNWEGFEDKDKLVGKNIFPC